VGAVTRPEYARAEIRDPDGNPIELRQWLRPSTSGSELNAPGPAR